jgi:hypothetical protein
MDFKEFYPFSAKEAVYTPAAATCSIWIIKAIMFFRIGGIQKKMESNRNMQTIMKGIGFLIVFMISFCSLNQPDTKIVPGKPPKKSSFF